MEPSERIANQEPYYFDTLNRQISQLKSQGLDIIRLDIGSPDLPPANFIIESLTDSLYREGMHRYSPYGGTPEFKAAVSRYYQKRFGVFLDPGTEVLGLIGSKEGIFEISPALLNPGDLALIPDPAYPTYRAGALFSGADVFVMPLLRENQFLPDLDRIPVDIARKAKVLWLNFPNNPTGAVADLDFFSQVIKFAREHQIVVLHDAPYMEIYYSDQRPPSILQVPGSKDLAIEFNSLSKTYNMAGWRVGMAVGNHELVSYLHTLKMQIDTSHFLPIQAAAVTALTGDQSWIQDRNSIYRNRMMAVVDGLKRAGFKAEPPDSTIYVWFRLPDMLDDHEFCGQVLETTGVSMTPGSIYGKAGKGYVRISLCTVQDRISEAMDRLVDWVKVKN